jgi:tryptophanyl-tRNA synthetase
MNNLTELDEILKVGAQKAANVANEVLQRVREKLGY